MQHQPITSITNWRRRSLGLTLAALTLLCATGAAVARDVLASITGTVQRIVDGDTLDVGRVRIRLHALDAPEMDHLGGREARDAMQAIVGDHMLVCQPDGTFTHKRTVATCTIAANRQEIAAELIRRGFAFDCWKFGHGIYAAYETERAKATLQRAPYCRTRTAQ